MLDSEYGVQRQAVTEQGRADPRQTLTALRRFYDKTFSLGMWGRCVVGRRPVAWGGLKPSDTKGLGMWAVNRARGGVT